MIKHVVAGIVVLLSIWASFYMISLDKEVHKLDKISALIKSTAMEDNNLEGSKVEHSKQVSYQNKQTKSSQNDEAQKKLEALKQKAGNIALFKVSPLYKKRCSSCHGVMGEGIIGPKLRGQDEDFILNALHDFKSGKRKNYVMYGLLGNMDEEQIKSLAKEISTFEQKYQKAVKN